MKPIRSLLGICVLGTTLLAPAIVHAQAVLYGVGDLPGGVVYSEVRDASKVSGVIYAVGGTSSKPGTNIQDTAFLWTSTGGITALPDLVPNLTDTNALIASAITPDARFIASRARFTPNASFQRHAVRVTTDGFATLDLGALPGNPQNSAATTISADGSILYGFARYNNNGQTQAVRWIAAGPTITAIPFAVAGDDASGPAGRGASADGSVMVGTSTNSTLDAGRFYGVGNHAFRYVDGSGVATIPYLAGGTWNAAMAVSPDGNLVLVGGDSLAASNGELYLFNATTQSTTALGTPAGGWEINNVTLFGGMNADGSLVVTSLGRPDGSPSASFLRNSRGWHALETVLLAAGVDLTGWTIDSIIGMSADGTLIWGSGNHNGNVEGVIVEFPAGYLANYVGEAPPISIVGAWTFEPAGSDGVITFLNNGYFTNATLADDGQSAPSGMERGTYTWDPGTGAFRITSVLVDTNGTDGASGVVGVPATATFVGDYLTVDFPAVGNSPRDLSTLVRVTGSSPIVGSWVSGNPALPDSTNVLTFFANGTYYLANDSVATGNPPGQDGMERGTYTWNPATGAFSATTLTDTNGQIGLSQEGSTTVSVNGDILTLTDSVAGSSYASRVRYLPAGTAVTIPVTSTNDSGAGSLREAIDVSNSFSGEREIILDVTGTITLTSGLLQITSGPLTITGPGAGLLTIDGNANSRIFSIIEPNAPACPALTGPNDYLVSISGVTLQNARRNTDNSGGAILSTKSLALDSVVVRNNVAPRGAGLAFLAQYPGQSLTITNSQFLDNVAKPTAAGTTSADHGAGLVVNYFCNGTRTPTTVTISNSLFRGNRAQPTTTSGVGAGISLLSFGTVTISDSRIVDNHVDLPTPRVAGYQGGGIYGYANSLTIERTEIAENSADIGGGIHLYNNFLDLQLPASAMSFVLVNSTVSGNAAVTTGGGINLFGNVAAEIYNSTLAGNLGQTGLTGDIRVQSGATSPASSGNARPPTLKLVSSIVAKSGNATADIGINSATVPTPYVVDATNSLVQSPGTGAQVEGSGNFLGVDPYLGPLGFNGGPTRTHVPLATSVVIDRGANPLGLTTDQRGAGFDRVKKAAADMGAYEGPGAFLPSVGFLPPVKYAANNAFLRVATDLDGDGFTDLASVNATGNTVDVLINNGNGTFATRTYPVGVQPAAIVACDVTGDNVRDLVTVNTGSNSLSILVNQGDGTFGPATTLATGSGPTWLTCSTNSTVPLRHNLYVVNGGDGTFMQFQDDGAGNFTLNATVPIGADPRQISTSDLDFDFLRDSVTFNFGANTVSVLKQGTNFAYTKNDYPVQAGPISGGLTDVSGDGFLDIIALNSVANSVSILINTGGTSFGSAVHYPVGARPLGHTTGDFDRDGSIDIAVRNFDSNNIAVLRNNGDGTFAPAVFYPVGGTPASINATDFDGDGVPDLVVAVSSINGVAVLYGNGNGTFRPAVIYPVGANPGATVQVADLNGDGRPDIAVPLLGENKVAVLLNTAEFRLGPVARINYQGRWSKAPAGAEPGWAISFAHQGDTIVATWATYGSDGKPLWLTAVLTRSATNVYSGNITTATGPSYEVLPFDSSKVVPTVVGSMTVTFFGSDNAELAYTVNGISQAKTIARELFASPAPTCSWGAQPNLALATNFQDSWGSATELGWSIAFAHEGDTIVATWFTFGADGKPVWFSVVAQKTALNVYAGPLSTSTGPPFSAAPWEPAVVTTVVGSATLTFADGNRAVFTSTVNGTTQNRDITRLVFAAPGSVCF